MQSAMRLRVRVNPTKPPHTHSLNPSRLSSTSTPRPNNYAATLQNLRIGAHTRVIFQGFTGRQATANAKESIAWGTNIVGGTTPGREGTHLGLPVLPSVRAAMETLKPDATGIYVPATAAVAAIEEAIEAEIPLIVAVAEHIPLHDMLRIHSILKMQTKSRLVGPNSPGIISAAAHQRCRIGFQPLPCFSAGSVGIAAKSGTLSYEAVASTTRAGLGQSLCIGVGGDVLPGTDLVEALAVLAADPATRAIALIGELGGDGEVRAAQWVREYHAATPQAERKPICALVAGRMAPRDGEVMGHAGAFWLPGDPGVVQKVAALRAEGVGIVNHPARFGEALRAMLGEEEEQEQEGRVAGRGGGEGGFVKGSLAQRQQERQHQQRRELHTAVRASSSPGSATRPTVGSTSRLVRPEQSRSLHLSHTTSTKLFKKQMSETTGSYLQFDQHPVRYLAISIDRATRSQCITAVGYIHRPSSWNHPSIFKTVLLPPNAANLQSLAPNDLDAISRNVIEILKLCAPTSIDEELPKMRSLLLDMDTLFHTKEAKIISLELTTTYDGGAPEPLRQHIHNLRIDLDDATPRSGHRLHDVHDHYSALEQRAPGADAKDGIVYHRLNPTDPLANIGTLVNGAGLAMNTVDALADAGGRAANFLDTGGKATAETVRAAFELVLRDARVKVVFVNIFGGLTLGDMIARGIILAFKELRVAVPVVVRIRGTNEREGQRIIAQSGLSLFAFDDFDEAAAKAIALAEEAEAASRGPDELAALEAAAVKAVEEANEREERQTEQEAMQQRETLKNTGKPWARW